jgi:hypothetical protein
MQAMMPVLIQDYRSNLHHTLIVFPAIFASLSTYQQGFPQLIPKMCISFVNFSGVFGSCGQSYDVIIDPSTERDRCMNIETLAVLLLIAALAALIARALVGYSLQGCLVAYVLACLGAVGGWVVQSRYFVLDQWLVLPIPNDPAPVAVIGASIGALLISVLGSLLGRPSAQPVRRRYRR